MATRFGGEPEVADAGHHRPEHHHVQHEGAADGQQLDAGPSAGGDRDEARADSAGNNDEGEHHHQQDVEDADELAVEAARPAPVRRVGHGRDRPPASP